MNSVVLVGRLTKEVECRTAGSKGTLVAMFTLAIDRDYKNADGTKTTDFIPVEVMGKPAEFCANYITKGRLVGIIGSIRVDRYETPNGEKRTFTKVTARNVQALDSKKEANNNTQDNYNLAATVTPADFSAVEDDEVPF